MEHVANGKAAQGKAGHMDDELRKAYEYIRKTYRDLCDAEIAGRHEIGQVVSNIKNDPDKYGTRAVAVVATALGCDASILYDAAVVAATWSREEIKELTEQSDADGGQALTWSHLVELSRVEETAVRDSLVVRVRTENLSVRRLKRTMAGSRLESEEQVPGDDTQGANPIRALRHLKAQTETWVAQTAHREALIFKPLEADNALLGSPEVLGLLEKLRAVQVEAKRVQAAQLKKTDRYIALAKKLAAGSTEVAATGAQA